ncbi:MAG: RagB/SusD family nutrient uptake outer membrane protein [Tannerella sp.]|jgi:hypothetical protein|nr:RagB/SusD family nutrient uptake outer membrane protein [Tannerella sp.]
MKTYNIKMKKTLLTGCALALFTAGTIFSCNVMDTQPFTSYNDDIVWGSKVTADAFVNGVINNVMNGYINGNQTTWEERTNNVVHNNGTGSFVRDEIDRYDGSGGFGNFGVIRSCNLIIEKAAEYNGHGLSENESKEFVAKGKLLRALTYYQQARTMGRFVWVDRTLSPADTANGGLMMSTTQTTTESYTYITNDIQAAIPDLPETAPGGALHKNVARAFLSEVALQAAAYETNVAKRKEWLSLAIAAANSVTNGTLADDYGSIFNEEAPNHAEIIFAVYRDKANTITQNIAPLMNLVPLTDNDRITMNGCEPMFQTNGGAPFFGWLWWAPTQNLVDAYDVIDASTNKAVKWSESTQFRNSVRLSDAIPDWTTDGERGDVVYSGEVTAADASVSSLMYENRDARFYETFLYDGITYRNEEIRLTVRGNLWRKVNGGLGPHIGTTNYYIIKGVYKVEPRVAANIPINYHFVVMRYGRVLLNKAEAILWLAGMGESNYSEAAAICNQLRSVHGKMPPAEVASLEEAWKLYIKERRIELVMENDFYWSLLRWGKHGGYANNGVPPGGKMMELTVSPTYIEIANDRKSFYVGRVTHGSSHVRNFREERRYLLPIPQGQIERNPNLGPNNPGW